MTHYLIYKITNLVNGKFYIGQHKTDNLEDNYWGSGLSIQRAIHKYGIENFVFTVLIDLKNEEEMNLLEELVVNEDFISRPDVYNMKVGGKGGWPSVKGEKNPMYGRRVQDCMTPEEVERWKANISKATSGENNPMYGHVWSDEARHQMSKSVKEAMKDPSIRQHISNVRKAQITTKTKEERILMTKPMSDALRGCKYWNNGIDTVLSKECPGKGWTLGNLSRSKTNTGRHWYNDGNRNVFCEVRPPGFSAGLIRKKKKSEN